MIMLVTNKYNNGEVDKNEEVAFLAAKHKQHCQAVHPFRFQ